MTINISKAINGKHKFISTNSNYLDSYQIQILGPSAYSQVFQILRGYLCTKPTILVDLNFMLGLDLIFMLGFRAFNLQWKCFKLTGFVLGHLCTKPTIFMDFLVMLEFRGFYLQGSAPNSLVLFLDIYA